MNRKIGILFLIVFVLLSGCVSSPDSGKGTLILTSSPSGSEIYLDNQYRGTTPVTIPDVDVGTHLLEYRHTGYKSWSTSITAPSGSSYYYAALTSQTILQLSPGISPAMTSIPVVVTIQAGKKTMIVGDSNLFSGAAVGTDSIILTLYGPGKYSKGLFLVQQKVNEIGQWSYTWNPGSSVQSGSYTMTVSDPRKTTFEKTEFTIIGGGLVSISPSSYSVGKGDSVTFSGQCTTGAQNVLLVLYGPGQYAGGVELGSPSVLADQTWIFKYTLDPTVSTGIYTIYVYDVPKTSSSTTQFTVGYAS
jgi:hypothetical protein